MHTKSESSQLHAIATELEALQVDHSKKMWVQYTTGIDLGVEEAQLKTTAFLKRKELFRTIETALQTDSSSLVGREAKILYNAFRKYHYSDRAAALLERIQALEVKLGDLLNKHRSRIDGREMATTEISRLINESPDRETRKKAFLSRTQVNAPLFAAGFPELLELRREVARLCEFDSFVSFRLNEDELEPKIFDGWKTQCAARKKAFNAEFDSLAQKHLGVEEFAPWDRALLANAICSHNDAKVDLVRFLDPVEKTFAAFGFDLSKLNLTYDVFPRKNKSEWGYNFPIEMGRDARILANVSDRLRDFDVLMHETAHGVHFLGLDPDDRILNMGVSGIVAEGFANFFGDVSRTPTFLKQLFGQEAEPMHRDFDRLQRFNRLGSLNSIVEILFDQALYTENVNTLDDVHQLKWRLSDEIHGRKPYAEEPLWGYVIHHTIAPVYLHNYLLGDVMCSSMKSVFKAKRGMDADRSPREFGEFWREQVLAPSGRHPFPELYERVCGKALDIGSYLDGILDGEQIAVEG